MTLELKKIFNLYLKNESETIDKIFEYDMIKKNITNEDLEKFPEFTENNFKNIVNFCDYWQLKDDLFKKFKDQIVFKIIFDEKYHHLIEHIPSCLLKELETNNSCVLNRKCECDKIEKICGTYYDEYGSGHLYCLKYLFENKLFSIELYHKNHAINWASVNGHLEIIQYLFEMVVMEEKHKEILKLKSMDAIDCACFSGHLDIVRFLFEKGNDCTEEAINMASANGHLEVVRYLLEIQHKNCTMESINWASDNGHLKIVNYLKNKVDYKRN